MPSSYNNELRLLYSFGKENDRGTLYKSGLSYVTKKPRGVGGAICK